MADRFAMLEKGRKVAQWGIGAPDEGVVQRHLSVYPGPDSRVRSLARRLREI